CIRNRYEQRVSQGTRHILSLLGFRMRPHFFHPINVINIVMNTVVRIALLISAMIVFTFKRADIANRPDYVEEESVF
ncbi:hypothetical protein ACQ77J_004204, partial [Salmonella enterica subsp. enterica serovar Kentucky]